ncbi:MAG: DUF1549 domain-containing protein [Planctomycetaceae bacterium]|nr:DUF1549 domain-containing protein [Planctomycetaceae bacterium]
MSRSLSIALACSFFAAYAAPVLAAVNETKPAAPLASVEIENGTSQGAKLNGPDARRQLIVTGKRANGDLVDVTGDVKFEATPAGIVTIDETGLVKPLADGKATVKVTSADGKTTTADVVVENYAHSQAINFPNQIVPIFTKFGCNSGGCHGKASGQNGFKLSLLGFEPGEDFEHLVKEGRGRRLFPASPDRSLLLQKAVNSVPHGGGQRMDPDSHEYRLSRRWIAQGMPYGNETDPKVERISVYPEARILGRRGKQQLIALAHYTDGSIEDVTRMVQFEPNNTEMAEVSATGLVQTLDLAGEVAIMARYQGSVAVFRASMPLGAVVKDLPKPKNIVDEAVFAKLQNLGIPPSPVCDDSTFIRRVSVDIAGRLPTVEETREFLADKSPTKRDQLIERLLASGDYADYFANKWSAVLRNRRRMPTFQRGTYAFHSWIRESLFNNKPYNEFAGEILAASGDIIDNPPVAWYREVNTVEQQVEDTAQLFLGLRIQCARCHHHPFEKWSQRDYYGFSAFFSTVAKKNGQDPVEQRIYHKRGLATATNPKTGEKLKPTGLGTESLELSADRDPRLALADWMSDAANPYFAPSLANRYWKHFFGRGIVDPEDDMRVTNPASNPELLNGLSQHFIKSGFDLKELIRTICSSNVYQFSSEPNEYNLNDKQNFSRYYPKRLAAEVLLDSLDLATNSNTSFAGMPAGTKAVQLPDTSFGSYFLTVFGRPESASACECERSAEANLAQSLHLLNSTEVQSKLSAGNGRAATFAKDKDKSPEENIRTVYLQVFSRQPTADELKVALAHVGKLENKQQAYEDILWALVNTKEFLFNH